MATLETEIYQHSKNKMGNWVGLSRCADGAVLIKYRGLIIFLKNLNVTIFA